MLHLKIGIYLLYHVFYVYDENAVSSKCSLICLSPKSSFIKGEVSPLKLFSLPFEHILLSKQQCQIYNIINIQTINYILAIAYYNIVLYNKHHNILIPH